MEVGYPESQRVGIPTRDGKMQKTVTLQLLLVLLVLAPCSQAQENIPIEDDYENPTSDWRFIISPYAWLAGQATDVGGEKIRQSFNDVSSLANFGFQLNTVVMYKKWAFSADGTYADLGSNIEQGPLTVDVGIKQYMLDMKLGYLVLSDIEKDDVESVIRGWALEANAGAKYWQNDVTVSYKIEIGNPPFLEDGFTEPQAWWDLMVGVKARFILSRSVLLGISANGGGFGLGNSSKFSYDFTYLNTFKVSNLISVTAGYRTFRYKREDGEGDDLLETKVSAFGPLLGVSFVF
jgi:hypothetical protein